MSEQEQFDASASTSAVDVEYGHAVEEMRSLWQIRFTQLTVFVTINAGFVLALFSSTLNISVIGSLLLKITMLLLCCCFVILNQRVIEYYLAFRARAVELEKRLGFELFTTLPKRGRINSSNAVLAIYVTSLVFWYAMVLQAFIQMRG